VQRGLGSRAYIAGLLSVRREAGEHLFHRLLHADLTNAFNQPAAADERVAASARMEFDGVGSVAISENSSCRVNSHLAGLFWKNESLACLSHRPGRMPSNQRTFHY